MPSGAKKRKAAKKKQENKPNSSNIATHSQGGDGKKTHDEKESEGSENSSPMYRDHHDQQHSFTEGEEEDVEKRENTSSVRSFVTQNKSTVGIDHNNGESVKTVAKEEGNAVQRDSNLKSEDNSESKNVSIDYVEPVRESHDVVQRDSNLKPEDNFESKNVSIEYVEPVRESHDVLQRDSNLKPEDNFQSNNVSIEYVEPVRESRDVVQRDSNLKPEDNFQSKNVSIEYVEPVRESRDVVQRDSNLKPEDNFQSKNVSIEYVEPVRESRDGRSSSRSSDDEYRVVDKNIVVVESGETKDETSNSVPESGTSVKSVKPVDTLSEVVPQVVDGVPVSEAYNAVVESPPIAVSDKLSFSEEAIQVAESAPVENSVTSDVVVDENGKKMFSLENKGSEVLSVVIGSQINGVSTSDETVVASSDVIGFAAQENKDKLLSNTPGVDTSGAEHIKDSEVPECSESQPLVDSAPRVVQTTSWKSCCGLFEVLTGSSR